MCCLFCLFSPVIVVFMFVVFFITETVTPRYLDGAFGVTTRHLLEVDEGVSLFKLENAKGITKSFQREIPLGQRRQPTTSMFSFLIKLSII